MIHAEIERMGQWELHMTETQMKNNIWKVILGSCEDCSPVSVYGIFTQYFKRLEQYINRVFFIWKKVRFSQRHKPIIQRFFEEVDEVGESIEKMNLLRKYRARDKDIIKRM